jgi:hypothetical protein
VLTVVLALVGVAVAMGLIGLGVILRKRTPLRRSCHTDDRDGAGRCARCDCDAEAPEMVDEP